MRYSYLAVLLGGVILFFTQEIRSDDISVEYHECANKSKKVKIQKWDPCYSILNQMNAEESNRYDWPRQLDRIKYDLIYDLYHGYYPNYSDLDYKQSRTLSIFLMEFVTASSFTCQSQSPYGTVKMTLSRTRVITETDINSHETTWSQDLKPEIFYVDKKLLKSFEEHFPSGRNSFFTQSDTTSNIAHFLTVVSCNSQQHKRLLDIVFAKLNS